MGNCCSPVVAGDVFDGVLLCCLFPARCLGPGTELSQFLRDFLSTFASSTRKMDCCKVTCGVSQVMG